MRSGSPMVPVGPILLTSRDFDEYLAMFDVTAERLVACCVLDGAAGASDFAVRLRQRGGRVISVDPLYARTPGAMRRLIGEDLIRGARRADEAPELYDLSWMGSIDAYVRRRAASAEAFLDDVADPGRDRSNYLAGSLPHMPFRTGSFDLALVGNLLFTYGDRFDERWHRAAIEELLRVAGEVRLHPLREADGKPYRHRERLLGRLRDDGVDVEVRPVAYHLHSGVEETVICRRSPSC